MKLTRHKSLIREISPGVIQIGNSPYAPSLTLNGATGGMEVSSATASNISGDLIEYKDAIFQNRPTVSGRNVLLEGDITSGGGGSLTEIVNNTGELLEASIIEASGILQILINQEAQYREDGDIILNNAIEQISGLLTIEINKLELNISNISGDINNINDDIINANTNILELRNDLINTSGDIANISGDISIINNNILSTNADITEIESSIISISGDVSSISSTQSGISYLDAENLAKKWAIIFG